jgi:hypothetical protein
MAPFEIAIEVFEANTRGNLNRGDERLQSAECRGLPLTLHNGRFVYSDSMMGRAR